MGYDIGWIIPRLRNPGTLWNCASTITVAVVGLFSKLIIGIQENEVAIGSKIDPTRRKLRFLEFLNKTTVYNKEALTRAMQRPAGVPLLTVSNHHSCFDDPGLWGVLPPRVLCVRRRMRWSLAAHDICFTQALHAWFFALGKCVPVVRGAGVYQPAIDFCIERLQEGEWVHIFPEGRVNVDKEHIRTLRELQLARGVLSCTAHRKLNLCLLAQLNKFKWGVGRMVWESARAPLVVPVWHEGLDRVLPNREPYLLQFRKRTLLHVGDPIRLDELVHRLRARGASEEESRAAITARIQNELLRLRNKTHRLLHSLGDTSLLENRTDILVNPSESDNDKLAETNHNETDPPVLASTPADALPNGTVRQKEKAA